MDNIFLYSILSFMVIAAILTVITDKLFTAVVYSGVLSVFTALSYLLLGAPDVALAEAVIGSTLATAILLATLRKYRIFTIYIVGKLKHPLSSQVIQTISKTLQESDIEPNILHSQSDAHSLFAHPNCDLVVEQNGDSIILHGEMHSQYFSHITEALSDEIIANTVLLEDSINDSSIHYKGDDALD